MALCCPVNSQDPVTLSLPLAGIRPQLQRHRPQNRLTSDTPDRTQPPLSRAPKEAGNPQVF